MSTDIVDVIGTANIEVTLTDEQADAALWVVLRHAPQLLGVEEWDGPKPALNGDAWTEAKGDSRLAKILANTGYKWARPRTGGNPIVYASKRYGLLNCYAELLHKASFAGHLAGRKSMLPASRATVGIFEDLVLGGTDALVVIHLTAEVQNAAGNYRLDAAHALRVVRHRIERRKVRLLVLELRRAGHRVKVVGDTNFDGMPLPPLVPCWDEHAKAEATGTLGSRTVDYVYADKPASRVTIIPTASDHDAVVAEYPR